jgi:hypothetical protein
MINRPSSQDYYQVLEVDYRASTEEIQSAYERAREVYGTESVVSSSILSADERREILRRVTDAYHTLIAEGSRRLYDESLAERSEELRQILSSHEAARSGSPLPAPMPTPASTPPPSPPESPEYLRLVAIPARLEPEPERFPVMLGVKEEATGSFLKGAREAAGVDLRSISEETKIGVTMLGYIEEERLDRLPVAIYLKNFVQQYARFLGLEEDRVARSYVARIRRLQSKSQGS